MNIAEGLKKARLERSLEIDALATFLAIDKGVYRRWEKGDRRPDLTMLARLARYYDMTIDELVLLEEEEETDLSLVLTYRDLRIHGLNDKFAHGLIKQIYDLKSEQELPVMGKGKVKGVYKRDVVEELKDLIHWIETNS